MTWNKLTKIEQVDEIIAASKVADVLIFKHSTSCNISSIAKFRLESDWDFDNKLAPYYLDLLSYREISNHLATVFQVHHESPQVLLIRNGECFFDTSHLDISVAELKEVLVPTT